MSFERYTKVMEQGAFRRFMIPLPDGEKPYLERLVLDENVGLDGKPGRTYLHVIHAADGDRDPHCHPWDFASTIVHGEYLEYNYARRCWNCRSYERDDATHCACGQPLMAKRTSTMTYGKGTTNFKKAHELHSIVHIKGPVVTLVTRGPKVRDWGFMGPEGWEHHASYIARKFPGAQPTEVD